MHYLTLRYKRVVLQTGGQREQRQKPPVECPGASAFVHQLPWCSLHKFHCCSSLLACGWHKPGEAGHAEPLQTAAALARALQDAGLVLAYPAARHMKWMQGQQLDCMVFHMNTPADLQERKFLHVHLVLLTCRKEPPVRHDLRITNFVVVDKDKMPEAVKVQHGAYSGSASGCAVKQPLSTNFFSHDNRSSSRTVLHVKSKLN
jgi:hypothetical protein